MKRIINLVLCMALMLGILPTTGAFAASEVVFEGDKTTVFEQSFGGLTGSSDLSDFTVTGSKWQYNDYFMGITGSAGISEVYTTSDVDLTNCGGFELSTKITMTYQRAGIYLGYDRVNCKGYMLQYNSNDGMLKLYKDTDYNGTPVATAPASGSYYGADVTYNITLRNNILTVNTSASGDVMSYSCDPEDDFSGTFGVITLSTADFALHYMNLYKYEANTVVDTWKYEKNFTASDSIDKLGNDGITLSNTDATFEDGYINTSGNQVLTYGPMGKNLSGDYTFETKLFRGYNHPTIRFNCQDDRNYYQLMLYTHANYADTPEHADYHTVRITKVVNGGTPEKIAENKYEQTETGGGYQNFVYKVSVEETAEGLKIDASVQNVSTTQEIVKVSGTDTTDYFASGKVQVRCESTGGSQIYYIKALSTPSEETYTKDVVVTNKSFTSTDTVASLATKGITFSVAPASFEDGYINLTAGQEGSYVEYAPNGQDLGDNYTFSTKVERDYNDDYILLNYQDDSNYYKVVLNSQNFGNNAQLIKVKGGQQTILHEYTPDQVANWAGTCGTYTWREYNISVENTDEGLNVVAKVANGYNDEIVTLTATDTDPISSGKVRIGLPNSPKVWLYYIKQTEQRTMGGTYTKELPVLNKSFSSEDTEENLAGIGITFTSPLQGSGDNFIAPAYGSYVAYAPSGHNLSDSYSFKTKLLRGYNDDFVQLNYVNDSNYYKVVMNSGAKNAQLIKVQGTNTTVLDQVVPEITEGWANTCGTYTWHEYDINVENTDEGLKIVANIANGNTSEIVTLKATDTNPVLGGTARILVPNSDNIELYYITYNEIKTYGDTGEYQGHFYVNNIAADSIRNGEISFEFPVAYMGQHVAVAALYEDNQMSEIKTFEPEEMYAGTVNLFDITSSEAEDVSVKVFVFDSSTGLNKLTEVYELR